MLQAVEEARVGRVRVAGFSVSLDGFGAGPEQSLQDPLGKRGTDLQLVLRNEDVQGHVRRGRWLGGRERDLCPPLDGRLRCLHPWPEHVRSCAREWLDDSW